MKPVFDPQILKNFFKSKKITQRRIADETGVSIQSVNAYVNGKVAFGKKVAAKWSRLYGLSEVWLLTGKGNITDSDHRNCSTEQNDRQDNIIKKLDELCAHFNKTLTVIESQQRTIEMLIQTERMTLHSNSTKML